MKGKRKDPSKEYICTNCAVSFVSITVKSHTSKFCSEHCKYAYGFKDETCPSCNKDIKVRKNKIRVNYFCSKPCYFEHKSVHADKYNTKELILIGRKFSNSPEAISKMKATKIKNGTMIDWKDANWKQFWRKCNALIRKMKPFLLQQWDGLDYIDGEYIKSNLSLPFKDKNYPTLDHVKPKILYYKEGKTPIEACSLANLAWTKRSNNSKKGIKWDKTLDV